MSKSINNICHNEKKRKRTSFNFIFCPNTKILERGLSSCSWFSLNYVTFSCNVSTSKRSRWVEEMQCEKPWADGELMKPWCKCYVASQPIFYTTTVQQSWKNTLEGNITSTKSFDCLPISSSSSPLLPVFFLCVHICWSSLPALFIFDVSELSHSTNLPLTAGLMCVSDSCHLTPGLIRPVSLVSTFPACSPHPGAHRLACSSSST